VTYDCVTYNRYLETLRTHEFGQYSIWLFLPAANRIFTVSASLHTHEEVASCSLPHQLARSRVYISKKVTRKRRAEAPPRVEVVTFNPPPRDALCVACGAKLHITHTHTSVRGM
jgi:hypothetical protein